MEVSRRPQLHDHGGRAVSSRRLRRSIVEPHSIEEDDESRGKPRLPPQPSFNGNPRQLGRAVMDFQLLFFGCPNTARHELKPSESSETINVDLAVVYTQGMTCTTQNANESCIDCLQIGQSMHLDLLCVRISNRTCLTLTSCSIYLQPKTNK